MRSGFTAALNSALSGASRSPRLLLELDFPAAGTQYLSDQAIGVVDGLASDYTALVESWGTYADTATDPRGRDHSLIPQMSVAIWNGGASPFSELFLTDAPETVTARLYLWAKGLTEADKYLLDSFVLADPIEFDEASRLLTLDLIGRAANWSAPLTAPVLLADWPQADPQAVGCYPPYAVGSPGRIPALAVRVAKGATLARSVLQTDTEIEVQEDLDEIGFPASGTVQLGEEQLSYAARTSSTFTGCTRAVNGTQLAQHLRGTRLVELVSDHTYLFCEGPVTSIANVQVAGRPAPAGIYTVDASANPARVIFSQQPYYFDYDGGSRFYEAQFDTTEAADNSWGAAYAYDVALTTSGAMVDSVKPELVISRQTGLENLGEIRAVYLSIAHWETGLLVADYIEVELGGQLLGTLNPPNTADSVAITGEVDIDHGHGSSGHTHVVYDPDFSASAGDHAHSSPSTNQFDEPAIDSDKWLAADFPLGEHITSSSTVSHYFDVDAWEDYDANTGIWCYYDITAYNTAFASPVFTLKIVVGGVLKSISLPDFSGMVYVGAGPVTGDPYLRVATSYSGRVYEFVINEFGMRFEMPVTISSASVVISTAKIASGDIDPATDDVVDLVEQDNRPLISGGGVDNPSRTVVDQFDLTELVAGDWPWLVNKPLTIRYVLDATEPDNQGCYILHTYFQIEYAERRVQFSDEISAVVTAQRTAPDVVLRHLVETKAGEVATDLDTSAAGSDYTVKGYRLDGLIAGDTTIREAVKKILRQTHSRLIPGEGKFRLHCKETAPASAASLVAADLRMRAMAVSRQPVSEIANRIDLAYDFDWHGDDGYRATARAESAASIGKFGVRMKPDDYQFELIKDANMAAAVAAYYIYMDGSPSTWYRQTTYLHRFGLQAEDAIELTASFNQLTAAQMTITGASLTFGSAKTEQISLIELTCEQK